MLGVTDHSAPRSTLGLYGIESALIAHSERFLFNENPVTARSARPMTPTGRPVGVR